MAAASLAVRNGQSFIDNRATIIVGLSIGNSYFHKLENLQKIFDFAKKNSDEIMVFLPAEIYEHNNRAVGSKHPRRSARAKGNYIRNKCQEAIVACGLENNSLTYVSWTAKVETSPAYIKALNYVTHLYKVNDTFHADIRECTEHALVCIRKAHGKGLPGNEAFDSAEGVLYPLKELAFFSAVPKIYKSCERFVFIYHKRCTWLEKFFDGVYDGIVKPYFGFYILEE